jgi:glycosyltransferase involved in cell wall biosynthesis
MLIGDGPERIFLESLVNSLNLKDYVEFVGFVSNPLAYMTKADLFVLSSQFEGFPAVLIETLACGVNVVSTDCEHGPREILGDGKWGRLVPVQDISALSKAIHETLLHPLPAEFLKARGNEFTVNRASEAYYDVFKTTSAYFSSNDFTRRKSS